MGRIPIPGSPREDCTVHTYKCKSVRVAVPANREPEVRCCDGGLFQANVEEMSHHRGRCVINCVVTSPSRPWAGRMSAFAAAAAAAAAARRRRLGW